MGLLGWWEPLKHNQVSKIVFIEAGQANMEDMGDNYSQVS